MEELSPDIMAVNETWLRTGEEDRAPKLSGYRLIHTPRPAHVRRGRGGGVGFYIRKGLNVRKCPHPNTVAVIEQMWVVLHVQSLKIAVGTAYRPPWQDVDLFLDGITESVTSLTGVDGIVLTGDFNINLLDRNSSRSKALSECIHSLSLEQLVTDPTHYTDHSSTLIDVVCTDLGTHSVTVKHSPDLGNHAMIMAQF